MITDELITLISNVGFPIVAFLLMFYQSSKTIKQNTKALNELIKLMDRKGLL